MLVDPDGRGVGYLRLSLTKACAMRCRYCRPAGLKNEVEEGVLSAGEIEDLVRHLAENHGLKKVRLTGGDPSSRKDLIEVIEAVRRVDGIEDLAMTTHGLTLKKHARDYFDAGVRRLNISLDTLNAERFSDLTGVNGLRQVLAGIDEALDVGFDAVKINSVVVKGQNERDMRDMVRFGGAKGIVVRFIELMPMGPLAGVWGERYVSEAEMKKEIWGIVESMNCLIRGMMLRVVIVVFWMMEVLRWLVLLRR